MHCPECTTNNKESLFDILLQVSELRMDIETAEKKIIKMFDEKENIELLEKLMNKYSFFENQSKINKHETSDNYFHGVVDGLNIAYKILNGIHDGCALDGIE